MKEIREEIRATAIFAGVFLVIVWMTRHQPGAVSLGCLAASFMLFLSIIGKKIPWTVFIAVNPSLAAVIVGIMKQKNAGVFDIVFLVLLLIIIVVAFNFWALSIMRGVRDKYYPRKPDLGKIKKRFFFCQGIIFLLLVIVSIL